MYKLKLILLIYFIVMVGHSNGQTNKYDIGIEAGPGHVYLRSNGLIKIINNRKTGVYGAFFFQYNFKKHFSIRTNIAFERKGSYVLEENVDISGSNNYIVSTHYNLDYLTLPVLIRAGFGRRVKFIINSGPYFSYLLKQSFKSKGEEDPSRIYEPNFTSKKFDAGISAGLGVLIPVRSKFALSLETRYNIGLYNIIKSTDHYTIIKTNSINFIFGLTYKLGPRMPDNKKDEK